MCTNPLLLVPVWRRLDGRSKRPLVQYGQREGHLQGRGSDFQLSMLVNIIQCVANN